MQSLYQQQPGYRIYIGKKLIILYDLAHFIWVKICSILLHDLAQKLIEHWNNLIFICLYQSEVNIALIVVVIRGFCVIFLHIFLSIVLVPHFSSRISMDHRNESSN